MATYFGFFLGARRPASQPGGGGVPEPPSHPAAARRSSVVKKRLHYWIAPETKQVNVQRVLNLLGNKGMPKNWWARNLRKSLD